MKRFEAPIADLLARPEILRLERREAHHFLQSRFEHCYSTARLAFWTARVLRMNARVATRAALLHDWYFENREQHKNAVGADVHHYRISAANARGIGESRSVVDAVASHMWPWGPRPSSREAWVVWMADNVTWLTDYLASVGKYVRLKARVFMYGKMGEYAR